MMNTYTSITNMCVYHGWTSIHWSCWTTVDSWGIMPQFSFCSTFHIAGAHCTTRHCIKDCVFGSLTLGCACIASVYFLELVFSIPRDRPRIILLLRCSVAGSPVRNPGSLSLVGNDPQKKPFICLSPACTSQQSQLSCNNLSFNCTLKHTWYLSLAPWAYPCKFFLAGVNFYRFNANNLQFTVYFAVITQKIGILLCILS